jgi:hypothetical protein
LETRFLGVRFTNDKSRMKREFHVRFCERLGLKCPCLLDFAFAPPHKANVSAKSKEPFSRFSHRLQHLLLKIIDRIKINDLSL